MRVRCSVVVGSLFVIGIACGAGVARGEEQHPRALRELPADKLAGMGPMLRLGDLALIESLPDGKVRQVTVLALVAAPPDEVRRRVATPERYAEALPRITKLKVEHGAGPSPGEWVTYSYAVDMKITELATAERLQLRPDGTIEVRAVNPLDESDYVWQFVGVPGGTLVVQYGYTDLAHAGPFVRRLVGHTPTLEHGLCVAAQLALVRSMKRAAEKAAKPGSFPPFDAAARAPGFRFLLERGRVAVIRSRADGHLSDISIIDNVYAPKEKVLATLMNPNAYASFIDGVKKSYEVKREPGQLVYETEFDLTMFSWTSRFAARQEENAVDVMGLSGDLRGARYRWDLTVLGPNETQIVYRANQDLAASSPLILGLIFRAEPLAEHGLAVSVGLMNVVGVRGRAEGWR